MSAFGGKAVIEWCCEDSPLLTQNRHSRIASLPVALLNEACRLTARVYSTETINFLKPRSVLFTLRTSSSSQRQKNRVHFEPRQMQANAGMRTRTKCDLFRRMAGHVKSVRTTPLSSPHSSTTLESAVTSAG